MFEDDPRADDFDRHGTFRRVETHIFSGVGISSMFKSGKGEDLSGYEERTIRNAKKAAGTFFKETAHGKSQSNDDGSRREVRGQG